MEVEVGHRLPRLLPAVGHHPEIGNAQLMGHLGDGLKAVAHQVGVPLGNLPAGGHVGLGDDQEVDGSLGVDVIKGVAEIILVHLVGGDLPFYDLTEQAVWILRVEHRSSLLY